MSSSYHSFSSLNIGIDKLPTSHLTTCMATCHSLTIIDNEINGDPLDVKMFEATGWQLEEPQINDSSKFDIITPTIVRSCTSLADGEHESQNKVSILIK